jgi:ADP-ribosylglycohydrolase
MRILPLIFYIYDKPIYERFKFTKEVSSVTHAHVRSVVACFYYLEFAKYIIEGKNKFDIYRILQNTILEFLTENSIAIDEISLFRRLLHDDISILSEDDIQSDGYVLHTLEASVWCLMTTENYSDAVLKAVNLGADSDTTAAVTGGFAGLYYRFDAIPQKWLNQVARYDDIMDLAIRFTNSISF